jgi:2-polyprenyl-6-methoxyphenol hydroxylase-like FAD-dependent oxidoreductase
MEGRVASEFDVIVVGARCAGSSLATLLARQGLKTAVLERATFPKDTLSTHIFQAPSINFLGRLGVLDKVLATGALPVNKVDGRQEDLFYTVEPARRPGDIGSFMSVRRHVLDPMLAEAAERAGASVMMSTNVTGLVRDGQRVSGVRATYRGRERTLRARLVVGADGRNSTLAELTGARKYNVTPGERFGYWGFFADSEPGPEPTLVYHRWAGRFVIAVLGDGGLYQVVLLPDRRFLPEFKADREAAFLAHARVCEPVAQVIGGARRVGKLLGVLKFECFLRESAGPGWALAGDAGHFKDPAPGQGMSDAFRQAEALAPVVAGAIQESDKRLDRDLKAWWRWRDRDAAEHYWLASDFGAAGVAPVVQVEILRRMQQRDQLDQMADVLQHRGMPSKVFTPAKLLGAAGSLMAQPGADRRQILREVRDLMATEMRRQRLNRTPEFVPLASHRDAGETEVSLEVAA